MSDLCGENNCLEGERRIVGKYMEYYCNIHPECCWLSVTTKARWSYLQKVIKSWKRHEKDPKQDMVQNDLSLKKHIEVSKIS